MRKDHRSHNVVAWTSFACAFIFLVAGSYCNLEAFIPHSHSDSPTHHGSAAEHHEHPASVPSHDDHEQEASDICCEAIKTVVVPTVTLELPQFAHELLHPYVAVAVWSGAFVESHRLATGLSPPTRAPTAQQPFYRTTFASHAPPVSLA